MAARTISPATYSRITLVALVALCVIVVTGAAVRLTGSGLGCSDWPNCEEGRLAPAEITDAPAMIEFVNRTITGVVSAAVVLAVLGSLRRRPRRNDLVVLSIGLVVGVLAQVGLGGLVVIFDLDPRLVMGHFLLSMVLIWNAVFLHHRARRQDGPTLPVVGAGLEIIGKLVIGAAIMVIALGTVVTASGPHAGDEVASRLDFSIPEVARLHSTAVWILLGTVAVFVWNMRQESAPEAVRNAVRNVAIVLVAQGAVGYFQYFTGVPVLLVGIHVAGAVLLWVSIVHLILVMRAPVRANDRAREAVAA